MSDIPLLSDILAYLEVQAGELGEQDGQLRSSIEDLTARLSELHTEIENVRITRKTLLATPRPEPVEQAPRPDAPDHPAYQQILAALADTDRPMRARDLCKVLDLPILPKNTEGPVQAETPRHTGHPHRTRTVHGRPWTGRRSDGCLPTP